MPKVKVNGLDMYYEREGSGPPVVMISGLTQDHLAWSPQVPALVAAGYQCITFDNRDAGQTSESSRPYAIRQFADDTIGLMDALGVPAAHVIGASMGGMIAQEMAINDPARVSGLTLVCTAPASDPELHGVLRAWKATRPHCSVEDFVLSAAPWLFTYRFCQQPEAVRGFLDLVRGNPFPQTVAGFIRQCDAIQAFDVQDRLAAIGVPTQVIVGAEDTLTPPHHSRALAAGIPGARLTEVPAAAHVLFLETPDAFNRAMLEGLGVRAGG